MISDSLYFFVGENTFLLSREVQRWKQNFRDKHGDENLLERDANSLSVSDLFDAVSSMPFIAEKRLVILRGIPKIEKEDLIAVLDALHPQAILLIVEPKPDKRLSVTKDIEKRAQVKVFPLVSREKLLGWIQDRVHQSGSTISDAARQELLNVVGEDQWILESEVQKLCLYAGSKGISVEMVDRLSVPSGNQVIWKLTDLVCSGKSFEALAFLQHRLDRGEDAYGIWIVLLNLLKNITLVLAATLEGLRDERSIATATGLHFYAVRGLLPLAKKLGKDHVRQLIDWATSMDLALKTGGLHAGGEHNDEVVALSERLILLCA